jgi:AraC-like DNA-binding protein
MSAYDGNKEYKIEAGDYGIARRNHLAKYSKQPVNERFEKVVLIFDQEFLKSFNELHKYAVEKSTSADALITLPKNNRVESFIQSLTPYFNETGKIDDDFFDIKRSELLLILLKEKPDLAPIFFDFGSPEKIDLEAFMNRNFRFNVTLTRFAYLTGRSLTSFKKDFERIFHDTPSRWLVQKRLQEAHFLIQKKGRKASDVYIEVGFEDLSHFSFAFKKLFGFAPTQLTGGKKKVSSLGH